MTFRWLLALALCRGFCCFVFGQTAPREGIQERPPRVHAVEGARIVVEPGEVIDSGTVVIRDGIISAVGKEVPIPPDARVWNLPGLTVTAGFIDLDLRVSPPQGESEESPEGRSWNPRIRPERVLSNGFALAETTAENHRSVGFTSALVSFEGGILAGSGALLSLGKEADRRAVIADRVAAFGGLEFRRRRRGNRGRVRRQSVAYPRSMMGAVALLRQTLYDADWYRRSWARYEAHADAFERPELNHSLGALDPVLRGEQPVAFRSSGVLELLALRRVAAEFDLQPWYLGSGEEYQWLELLSGLDKRLVIPLDFPEAPIVEHPDDAAQVSLRELETWARAPENAARLHHAGVSFALTPRGLKSLKEFPKRVRQVIDRGLPADVALASLTTVPAEILGVADRLGSVKAGKIASLVVFDGEPFGPDTQIRETWVDGDHYPGEQPIQPDLRGEWQLVLTMPQLDPQPAKLAIRGKASHPSGKITRDGKEARKVSLDVDGSAVNLVISGEVFGRNGFLRLGGSVSSGDRMSGSGRLEDGTAIEFQASRLAPTAEEDSQQAARDESERWKDSYREPLPVPLGARGRLDPPFAPEVILISGGTVWTSGAEGILEADVLIRDGKIAEVAKGIEAPAGAYVLDARGKHITPGLIDAHSHTAILYGVNEGTQAVTAEVRIGDVLRPTDINLYRQLAGGLSCAHALHGSANPIGGQSATIKLRWGEGPEGLKLRGAPGTIKFALGENVKRSNQPSGFSTRYPQTRMGVEQIIRDAFQRARDYQRLWREAEEKPPEGLRRLPRRDLELDALVEVLEGKRSVHCHSYRQDEILMLMRLAEEMGFRIGTFQHVLEGYKVAPELVRHGANASTFSDWWAYKFEVYDAIPYNGALMHQAGVVTTFNSDSSELARRLNLEAAKAVKYGGVPRAEALKFVTLNAAIQLGIEDRVGSLEEGKDADFVVWSGDPLSTYSICLETWIEGRRMFEREEDLRLRKRDGDRRAALIQRILEESYELPPEEEKAKEVVENPPQGGES